MRRSEGRILTTHAGSLPRPPELDRLWIDRGRGNAVDDTQLAEAVKAATDDVVARQAEVGIDVANDGEQGRESFFTYVRYRMSGFGGTSTRQVMRDIVTFPTFLEAQKAWMGRERVSLMAAPAAEGAVEYHGEAELAAEIDGFEAAVHTCGGDFEELFLTAPSPGIVVAAMTNRHYATDDDYLDAVATTLAVEYRAITKRGFLLQIDAPDLALERHTLFADRPVEEFVAFVESVVTRINRALDGVAREQVRLHVCWGNYEGPHHLDVPLEAILDALLEANVGGLVLSMANPRHAHEHRVLAARGFPADLTLVAGVIDTTTNYVEHPEVVADRIVTASEAIGDPTRVLAGTDCGFGTAAGLGTVAREVVWEKLRSLVAGAALASSRLFG